MEVNETMDEATEISKLSKEVQQYRQWWVDEVKKTEDLINRIHELQARIDELEDTVNLRAASIEELEIVNETLREKNAKLLGEICGLKYAMTVFELKKSPEEVMA